MPKSMEPTSGAKPKRSPGRPLKGTERFSVNLQVRVTEELANTVKSLGGADFLRPLIERAAKSGVSVIAQPGGSVRDDLVIDCCNKYGMAMAFTGMRLFHH